MLVTTPHLAPDSPFEELLVEIKEKHVESIALVGHEPDLGELAGLIISGEDQVALPLRKGGVCCINITETVPTFKGTLVWLLTPKQLRIIGK